MWDILLEFNQNSYEEYAKYQPLLKEYKFDLRVLLRSIDAAGNEIDTPPDVYAPAVRFIRSDRNHNSGLRDYLLMDNRIRKPVLSFHAGEDFAHIITGLRRIDETVLYYDYKEGDRVGHGLALGLLPKTWLEWKKEVILTKEEYLDNLVWLWNCAFEMLHAYAPAGNMMALYERKAAQLALELYDKSGITMEALYNAWILRRNCPLLYRQFMDDRKNVNPSIMIWIPDIEGSEYHKGEELFLMYHENRAVREKGRETISLRQKDFYSKWEGMDIIEEEEIKFWEAVQDYKINEYAKKGITIEVNPSSNLYISGISEYREHPLFRWNPPSSDMLKPGGQFNKYGLRTSPIEICINSDDPGIFPTSLQNEYKLIRECALAHYSNNYAEVDQWLNRIRKRGIEIFNQNHISPLFKR